MIRAKAARQISLETQKEKRELRNEYFNKTMLFLEGEILTSAKSSNFQIDCNIKPLQDLLNINREAAKDLVLMIGSELKTQGYYFSAFGTQNTMVTIYWDKE